MICWMRRSGRTGSLNESAFVQPDGPRCKRRDRPRVTGEEAERVGARGFGEQAGVKRFGSAGQGFANDVLACRIMWGCMTKGRTAELASGLPNPIRAKPWPAPGTAVDGVGAANFEDSALPTCVIPTSLDQGKSAGHHEKKLRRLSVNELFHSKSLAKTRSCSSGMGVNGGVSRPLVQTLVVTKLSKCPVELKLHSANWNIVVPPDSPGRTVTCGHALLRGGGSRELMVGGTIRDDVNAEEFVARASVVAERAGKCNSRLRG